MADVTSPFGFPYPEDTDLVRDGATDIENLAEGVNDYLAGGYIYAGTRTYTSSGSFSKADPLLTGDIGLRAVRVTVIGGGGGGRARVDNGAAPVFVGGGGQGGKAVKFILAGDLSATEAVDRGSGGAGGAYGSAGAGGPAGADGAASTFAGLTGSGGGGAGGFGAGGVGGAASGGDINITGQAGSGVRCNAAEVTQLVGGVGGGAGGAGAALFNLAGAAITDVDVNVAATDGASPGGGGGGGPRATSTPTRAGDGAPGIVIIDCFV
jgi:hypothetical protein